MQSVQSTTIFRAPTPEKATESITARSTIERSDESRRQIRPMSSSVGFEHRVRARRALPAAAMMVTEGGGAGSWAQTKVPLAARFRMRGNRCASHQEVAEDDNEQRLPRCGLLSGSNAVFERDPFRKTGAPPFQIISSAPKRSTNEILPRLRKTRATRDRRGR